MKCLVELKQVIYDIKVYQIRLKHAYAMKHSTH